MDKLNAKIIIYISLLVLLLLFILQNLESIRVRLLFIRIEMPLVIIIVVSFAIGYFASKIFEGKKG